jgi:hypothetical protein
MSTSKALDLNHFDVMGVYHCSFEPADMLPLESASWHE